MGSPPISWFGRAGLSTTGQSHSLAARYRAALLAALPGSGASHADVPYLALPWMVYRAVRVTTTSAVGSYPTFHLVPAPAAVGGSFSAAREGPRHPAGKSRHRSIHPRESPLRAILSVAFCLAVYGANAVSRHPALRGPTFLDACAPRLPGELPAADYTHGQRWLLD